MLFNYEESMQLEQEAARAREESLLKDVEEVEVDYFTGSCSGCGFTENGMFYRGDKEDIENSKATMSSHHAMGNPSCENELEFSLY